MTKTLKSIILTTIVAMVFTVVASAQITQQKDIIDTITDSGSFTILVKALADAGLVETLKSDGPFTVFAPTDDAFAKIPKSALDSLMADKAALKSRLLYHVVPGSVTPDKIVLLEAATTAEGSQINIDVEGSIIRINTHNVLTTMAAGNGIIYIIDAVLLPPTM